MDFPQFDSPLSENSKSESTEFNNKGLGNQTLLSFASHYDKFIGK
jgi:hypothetical protein